MNDYISRQAAIDALDEIRHALWEIDIPSPTVPEYIEHHEQIQSVWKLLDKKQKELYVLPSAQSERKRGKWIYNSPVTMKCDQCGLVIKDWDWHRFKFCPNCDCDMRGEQNG